MLQKSVKTNIVFSVKMRFEFYDIYNLVLIT